MAIGITDPKGALHIFGDGSDVKPHLRLEKTNTDQIDLEFRSAVNNNSNAFSAETNDINNNATFKLATTTNGSLMTLFGNGNANLTSLIQLSDATLKTNICPLQNSLSKIKNIHPIHYRWNDASKDQKTHIGLSAQNVRTYLPEMTEINDENYLTVNYTNMNAVLWEALKEIHIKTKIQNEKITEQEKKIESLKTRMQQLSKKNEVASHGK